MAQQQAITHALAHDLDRLHAAAKDAAARALIGRPELVIADEPTSALGEDARASFMQVLLDACGEAGSALVFVSHDARLASSFTRQVDLAALNGAIRTAEAGPA